MPNPTAPKTDDQCDEQKASTEATGVEDFFTVNMKTFTGDIKPTPPWMSFLKFKESGRRDHVAVLDFEVELPSPKPSS